jgi:hypothetical protein
MKIVLNSVAAGVLLEDRPCHEENVTSQDKYDDNID